MAERTIVLDGRTVYLSKCSNANDCRCMDSAAFAIANGSTLRPADAKAKARLVVVETFEIKGRGTAYIVEAGDPPYMTGDTVLLEDVPHVVMGVEMQPTATPRYVINGKQSLLLKAVVT